MIKYSIGLFPKYFANQKKEDKTDPASIKDVYDARSKNSCLAYELN